MWGGKMLSYLGSVLGYNNPVICGVDDIKKLQDYILQLKIECLANCKIPKV
jgi:hypothetical protein